MEAIVGYRQDHRVTDRDKALGAESRTGALRRPRTVSLESAQPGFSRPWRATSVQGLGSMQV